MDPFSITVGAVGLLSSLAALLVKLNELRADFVEAETEIDAMLQAFTDLTGILTRLQNSGETSSLPGNLSKNLASVLSNCNKTAVEAGVLLRNASMHRMRRVYWASTGKKECVGLYRGIKAHKATISIALNLCSMYDPIQYSTFKN